MSSIRAIVVDPEVPGRLAIKEVEEPQASPSEALVQVEATSLNRGDVSSAMHFAAGWRPGWDLAGTVIRQAANGAGPKAGSRVLGMLVRGGSWAEQVAVPTNSLAEIPASVTFAQAATLPIAGRTALHALVKGGLLLSQARVDYRFHRWSGTLHASARKAQRCLCCRYGSPGAPRGVSPRGGSK